MRGRSVWAFTMASRTLTPCNKWPVIGPQETKETQIKTTEHNGEIN